MKKLILILVIALCASQASAVLDVNFTQTASTITVWYAGAGVTEATRPRAFALKLTLSGGTFDSISGYKTGESTAGSPGYGIYPATITIDSAGNVTSWGDPVAASGDPGAGGGLGTDNIVLEFGSLYYGEPNAPVAAGTLCVLNYTGGLSAGLSMVGEDQFRITDGVEDAGVVFEDGSTAEVNVGGTPPPPPTCWDLTECPNQIVGDATCDGNVNLADLYALKAAWLATGPPWVDPKCCSDFNRSFSVNLADLYILKANWLTTGTGTHNQTCP